MYCNNCGNEIEQGSKFCGACGATVEDVAETVTQDVVFTQTDNQFAPESKEPKKSNKVGIIAAVAAVAVVVLVILGVLLKGPLVNLFMNTQSANKQLQYAYGKTIGDVLEVAYGTTDQYFTTVQEGTSTKGTVKLELSEEVFDLLGESIGLENISIDYTADLESAYLYGYDLSLKVNDKKITKGQIYMDMENGKMVAYFPDLN